MNDYCVDLNLALPLFNSNLPPIDFLKSRPSWASNVHTNRKLAHHFMLDITNDISKELHTFFNSFNFRIVVAEVFYTYPNGVGNIHSDLNKQGDYSKINWVFGGKSSIMNWYRVKDQTIGSINTTTINSYSIHYPDDSVDLVHSQVVGCPSLVQVGCPHHIVNASEERFCLSIVFHDAISNKRPTMAEALEIFKSYTGRP